MGTVGGNLFTPPPGGDVAVALLALDATVTLARRDRPARLPLADFWTGFMTNRLADDELLVEIRVPISAAPTAYLKFGRKHANTPAVVTVAVALAWDGGTVDRRPDRTGRGRAASRSARAEAERRLSARPRPGRHRVGRRGGRRRVRAVHRRHRHRVVPAPDDRRLRRLVRSSGWRRADRRDRCMASTIVTFTLGDREVEVMVRPMTTLQSVLRNQLGQTATKGAAGRAVAELHGARRRRADAVCLLPVEDVAGRRVTTLEGLTPTEGLHPIQQAFVDGYAFQCGYCTPGMIIVAKALLDHDPAPSRDEIRLGTGRQHLPLHRLRADRRGDRRGRRGRSTPATGAETR